MSLGKALNGMPPSLCGRQVVEPSKSTRRGGPSLTEDLLTEPERSRSVCTSSYIMLRMNSSNDDDAVKLELIVLNIIILSSFRDNVFSFVAS